MSLRFASKTVIFSFTVVSAFVFSFVLLLPTAGVAGKGQVKDEVCHITGTHDFDDGNGEVPIGHLIRVSSSAYPAHIKHGDPIAWKHVTLSDDSEACVEDEIVICHITDDTYDFGYGEIPIGQAVSIHPSAYQDHINHGDPEVWEHVTLSDGSEACVEADDQSNWMDQLNDIIGNRKLVQIALPGSHDAGMNGRDRNGCNKAGNACNTVTQLGDIRYQLRNGSRFFDIRPMVPGKEDDYDGTDWCTGHGYAIEDAAVAGCQGEGKLTFLNNLSDFFSSGGNNELVILKISHCMKRPGIHLDGTDCTSNQKNNMIKDLASKIDNLIPYYKDLRGKDLLVKCDNCNLTDMTLNEILELGNIILVGHGIDRDTAKGIFKWGLGSGHDYYNYDEYSNTMDFGEMKNDQIEKLLNPDNHYRDDELFLLSWTLTLDFVHAADCIEDSDSLSILDLAAEAAPKIFEYMARLVEEDKLTKTIFPHILYVDAYIGSATNTAIYLNQQYESLYPPTYPIPWFEAGPYGNQDGGVQFTDLSIGQIFSWEWDFDNDGIVDDTRYDDDLPFNWYYEDLGSHDASLTTCLRNNICSKWTYPIFTPIGGDIHPDRPVCPYAWNDANPIPPGWGYESAGGGIAAADINKNGRPELYALNIDNPAGDNRAYFRIGWDVGTDGNLPDGNWSDPQEIPGWTGENQGGGLTVGDINQNGFPDLIVFGINSNSGAANTGFYLIGWDLQPNTGLPLNWSSKIPLPDYIHFTDTTQGGITVWTFYEDTDPYVILLVSVINKDWDEVAFHIGNDINSEGISSLGWSQTSFLVYPESNRQGAGITFADLNGNLYPEVIFFWIDAPAGENTGHYRVGYDLNPETNPYFTDWSDVIDVETVPSSFGATDQGGGLAVADINGNEFPDMIFFNIKAPAGENTGYYRVGFDIQSNGVATSICGKPYTIGDTGPAGGIVFFVATGGLHGLEAAPLDQGEAAWGNQGTVIGADGQREGTGAHNTAIILAAYPNLDTAAKIADAYSLNGYTDWFLPSVNSLREMSWLSQIMNLDGRYWSSTEASAYNPEAEAYSYNIPYQPYQVSPKPEQFKVRPVRAF